jgi:hypothetical protein
MSFMKRQASRGCFAAESGAEQGRFERFAKTLMGSLSFKIIDST